MGRRLLQRGRHAQQVVRVAWSFDGRQSRPACGEGAGLVEQDDPRPSEGLQRAAALDDDAPTCRARDAAHDRDGHRKDEGAGRGHDQHREGADGVARHQPRDARDDQREWHEQEPIPVRETHEGRLGAARLLDEPDDAA